MRRLVLAVPSLAFLTACLPAVASLSEEDIAALNDLRAAYVEAVLANDCGAMTAVFAQNVVSLPPNVPMVEGRAAYRAACEAEESEAPPQDFTTTSRDIDGYVDLAFDRGTFSQTYASEAMAEGVTINGEGVTINGKYVVIARKQADDSWRWIVGIYNFDAPLPQPE
jgi:ketosteroid isomerase-like protein